MKPRKQGSDAVKSTKTEYAAKRKALSKKRKQYAAYQKALATYDDALARGTAPDEAARHAWGDSHDDQNSEDTEDGDSA